MPLIELCNTIKIWLTRVVGCLLCMGYLRSLIQVTWSMTSHHLIDRGCLLVVVCHHVWTISHNNAKGNSNKNILPKFLNPLVHHCINPGSVPTRNGVGDHFGYSLSSFLFISTIFLLDNCSKSIACSTKRAPVVYTATVSATNCCKTLQSRL